MYNKILDKNTPDFVTGVMNDSRREYFEKADDALQTSFRARQQEIEGAEAGVDQLGGDDSSESDEEIKGDAGQAKKIYDRGALDQSSSFDEQHYFKLRTQKLANFRKKDNHLLLYSNVNTLDFIDINQSNIAKAWTVLFHSRGKSIESMLFEEFNSIAQRNTLSKTRNHEVFNQLYLQLNQLCQ